MFLDEVSMLSCCDMYLISTRLARVMNNLDAPFGGLNFIFAGDFAQLPPVISHEHASLYSCSVGMKPTSLRDQEAAIGKALWHQITTVVIRICISKHNLLKMLSFVKHLPICDIKLTPRVTLLFLKHAFQVNCLAALV